VLAGVGVVLIAAVAAAFVAFGLPKLSSKTSSAIPGSSSAVTVTGTSAAADETMTTVAESDGLLSYADPEGRFTVAYPATWSVTSPSLLGSGTGSPDTAVAFADQNGPKQDGRYIDSFAVDCTDPMPGTEEQQLAAIKSIMEGISQTLPAEVTDLKVIEPVHSVGVKGAPGYAFKVSYAWRGEKRVKLLYNFIAEKRVFVVQFLAAEADFAELEPVFKTMMEESRF
jgi:hypothetical protein